MKWAIRYKTRQVYFLSLDMTRMFWYRTEGRLGV